MGVTEQEANWLVVWQASKESGHKWNLDKIRSIAGRYEDLYKQFTNIGGAERKDSDYKRSICTNEHIYIDAIDNAINHVNKYTRKALRHFKNLKEQRGNEHIKKHERVGLSKYTMRKKKTSKAQED